MKISRRVSLAWAATAPLALLPPAAWPAPATAPIDFLPAPGRIVAIGDVHGDCDAFERVLALAGLYTRNSGWTGGNAVLVQIGDVLDRGGQEMECLRLLRDLKRAAPQQGGAVVSLLGNHEVMNAAGITYMASARSAAAFEDRATAFLPGTELATDLASWPVACVVGDTAFCHATLTLAQAEAGLQAGNAEASRWLMGGSPTGLPPDQLLSPRALSGSFKSPVWTRDLSDPPDTEPAASACADLRSALARLGAKRLVVGHTVQSRCNCACDCSVWRIDVGLSAAMGTGAAPQALEIASNGKVRVLVGT